MGLNIKQVFDANPAASMDATDLMYLGRSPYDASDDFAITWEDLQLSITQLGTLVNLDVTGNVTGNNFLPGYSTTVTAAAVTVLTVDSAEQQFFTGSTTQTVTLPVVSTLTLGQTYRIVNRSSGNVTVQSSGANTIQVMEQDTELLVTCVLLSGTGTASWFDRYSLQDGALINPGSTNDLAYYASNGSELSPIASLDSSILITDENNVPSFVGPLLDGNIIIGETGAPPAAAFLTAGNGIDVTNGPGSITIGLSTPGFESSVIPFASAVALTTTVPLDITSISLTAGTWDVWGNVYFDAGGATLSNRLAWVSETSATVPDASIISSTAVAAQVGGGVPVVMQRFVLGSTTTIYLSADAVFSAACTACGAIYAREVM